MHTLQTIHPSHEIHKYCDKKTKIENERTNEQTLRHTYISIYINRTFEISGEHQITFTTHKHPNTRLKWSAIVWNKYAEMSERANDWISEVGEKGMDSTHTHKYQPNNNHDKTKKNEI